MNNFNRPVFLWGMMGSGKSTVGEYLKQILQCSILDLDQHLEKSEGKSIGDIFQDNGETYFRRLESSALKALFLQNPPNVIITGGGTPCYEDNAQFMMDRGLTVFIDCPIPIIEQRLKADPKSRPLLGNHHGDQWKANLYSIFNTRLPVYKQAHITIKVNDSKNWKPTLAGLLYKNPLQGNVTSISHI